ncbi:MAG TPA: hypothetical protein VIC26_07025, partial [Marinagarivorans sp.]
LALNTITSGDVIIPAAGLSHAGALTINADNLSDGDNDLTLAATDATLNLRDGSAAQTWNTSFDQLTATIAGTGDLTVVDSDALTIAGLNTGGAANVSATAGDLTLTAAPTVGGALALNTITSGDVIIPAAGLSHAGALTINADNLSDGDNDLTLAATDATLNLRDGSTAQTWNTSFDQLTATIAGTGDLTVMNTRSLNLAELTTGGAASVSTNAGDLTVLANPTVAGRLQLNAAGDLIIPNTGLAHGDALVLSAQHIIDTDNEIELAATDLTLIQNNGDNSAVFHTQVNSLDLTYNGTSRVSVNESDALEISQFNTLGDALISAGGDIRLLSNIDTQGELTLQTTGTGLLTTSAAGLSTSGDLVLDVASLVGINQALTVGATHADITLRNQQQALRINSDFESASFAHAATAPIELVQASDLVVTDLSSGGNFTVSGPANLQFLPSNPTVVGDLSLLANTLTIADVGLQVSGGLNMTAETLNTLTGNGAAQLQANQLNLTIASVVQNNALTTLVNNLSLGYAGAAPLEVNLRDATALNQLTSASDLTLNSSGNIQILTDTALVDGLLNINATGNVELLDSGLTAENLRIQALDLVSASGGLVNLAGSAADIALRGDSALNLNTQLAQLALSTASHQDVTLSNNGDLVLSLWDAPNTRNAVLTVIGDLQIPDTGLSAGNRLTISASDVVDSDRNLTLIAPELVMTLTEAADDSQWSLNSNQLDAVVLAQDGSSASLVVVNSGALTLRDLNNDGRALALSHGNVAVQVSSGDLVVEGDLAAADLAADGQRMGIIDLAAEQGDIVLGQSGDVAVTSTNTYDNAAGSNFRGQTDSHNAIRLRLLDTSDSQRQIILGNGDSQVALLAEGGDIELNAFPNGTDPATVRTIVQNGGTRIDAYNAESDLLTGQVTLNGDLVAAEPWQRIRQDRQLALWTTPAEVPEPGMDTDGVLDSLTDADDSIKTVAQVQEQGSDASAQYDAVFGTCNPLDENDRQRCRIDSALKAFLSHWLVGGEMPPKSEI